MCVEPIADIDFETGAIAVVELDSPLVGFRFRRTANTLLNVKLGDEVDLAAIQMRTIGDGEERGASKYLEFEK